MKQGDIGTELIFNIFDSKGRPINLTNASKVYIVLNNSKEKIERLCEILEPKEEGRVRYIIQEGDLQFAGDYEIEIRLEFNDGDVFTSSRIYQMVEERL